MALGFNPFLVLMRGHRRIVMVTLVAVVVAAALWFVIPKRYAARTLLYLPQQKSDPRLQLLASQLPIGGLNLGGGNQDEQLMKLVLNSRTLSDSIKARFGKPKQITPRET